MPFAPWSPWLKGRKAVAGPSSFVVMCTSRLLTAKCTKNDNATFLEITVHGDPNDPRVDDITGDIGPAAQPLANWGLHLIDVNLAMGNLVEIVGQQAKAFGAKRK